MNKERIKSAYIQGFMKAARVADTAAREAQNLLNPGIPPILGEAGGGRGLFGGFKMPDFQQPDWLANVRKHINSHPIGYSAGALGVGGGSALSMMGDNPSPGPATGAAQSPAHAAAGAATAGQPGAGHGQADQSVIQHLLASIKDHPYLWGGGAAAGLGLGALAASPGKKKQQPEEVPIEE